MMGGVEKTTVYLTTEQKAALARAAEAEGRSEARTNPTHHSIPTDFLSFPALRHSPYGTL